MRLSHSLALMAAVVLASVTYCAAGSWGSDWSPMEDSMVKRRSTETDAKPEEAAEGRNYDVREPIYSNETEINAVIDQIINSRREGRNLGEYDQVYADENIDQALQQGNDMQARNLIRDKLCGLGLMSCEVEEKRPFYSTIYAQGPPPPGASFGGGPYGPPRPMPPPNHFNSRPPPPPSSLNSFGPPRKVGYEGPFKPNYRPSGPGPMYNGPYLENPPPSAVDGSGGPSFSKPPPGAIIYGSKPPGPVFSGHPQVPPYNFEHPGGDKLQVAGSSQSNFYSHQSSASAAASNLLVGSPAVIAGPPAAAGLQQHVHHHYHHVEGDAAGAKVPSVPIPVGAGQSINTDFSSLAQSSSAFAPAPQGGFSQSSAFAAGFNGASQGGLLSQGTNGFEAIQKPNGELYKPSASVGNFGGASGLYQQGLGSSGFDNSGFGPAGGSFHSQNPDYFKKELHNTGGISGSAGYNGLSTGYGGQAQYPGGYDIARQQIVDCQCVPFNQCPAADRIGRKEDLILPIDPRNLGKDIEALSDEAAGNATVSANADGETKDKSETEEGKKNDDQQRRRRQANTDNKPLNEDNGNTDLTVNAEGRQDVLTYQAIELLKRRILPTYGVSFGLPVPANGYPGNPHGDYYPAENPHFGSIGPNGLNLGLVNVNPLVSVQVSKTDYGEKVVKPLVNLHVTPNGNILEQVGNLFKPKPEFIHSTHYHHHEHITGFEHEHHPHHIHSEPWTIPAEHYPSVLPPFKIVEMISSKPIFEYHSTTGISPPLNHYESSPYESSSHTSYGHTGFPSHSINNYPTATGSGGTTYPSTSVVDHGELHSTSGYGATGFSGSSYGNHYSNFYERSSNISSPQNVGSTTGSAANQEIAAGSTRHGKQLKYNGAHQIPTPAPGAAEGGSRITFPRDRKRRSVEEHEEAGEGKESVLARAAKAEQRAYYGNRPVEKTCRVNEVCCRRPFRPPPQQQQLGRCGVRNAAGITGRIKNPVYVDGDSEFGEYPWHVAILKKDPKESIYACGGTLIDGQHVITAAHCIKSQNGFDLRARLGEWDVNHDVEFFPYIERDVVSVHIHPEYYAGTLDNDLAILKLDHPVDFTTNPHISPACLPDKYSDFTGARCWTTGWGKDAFGEHGKYQNILKEVDVPILSHHQCETQLRQTRLGYSYKLNPGFVCAGGEEGKDACKGDGGGPLVCERNGIWNVIGVVSWGIGCGQVNVPGVYVRVAHYLDWIRQITQYYQ